MSYLHNFAFGIYPYLALAELKFNARAVVDSLGPTIRLPDERRR